MRYKLVWWLIVMSLYRGLMDMAHLGQQQIESTQFAKGVKNLPKWAPYTSGCFMITTQPNALGMRYKLVWWWIVMSLGRGLMDMAYLGRQQIESTRFAKGVKNWPKWASYTSGRFMITTWLNALGMRCKLVRWLIVMQ